MTEPRHYADVQPPTAEGRMTVRRETLLRQGKPSMTPLENVWEAIANLVALGVNVESDNGPDEPVYSVGIALDYLHDAAKQLEQA